ncbi:DUF4255 domain-containing protein [Microcoleus sp. FACHB-1515]|uniref:Pvc16 family protein n=1 Tax=Cyanophyceae TaxID=3028117 RepID=UPI0016879C86|nr:Pvc16 family protein [Microcoleus sp. FACHB-1515]MBD2089950.1 DUF4255 domain-containing protein [Microcoleus sp. FACHB-1515]
MIHRLDALLRRLFIQAQIPNLTTETQIRFQPPDGQWRSAVGNIGSIALNVYLVDLRENRKLRSNESVRSINNGVVSDDPAPARLDCHYLITAWSAAEPALEPALDEHELLYQVAAVLMHNPTLNPSRILAGSSLLNGWTPPFRDIDLPVTVLPAEGFPKLSEFWHSMGQGAVWKPAVYAIVTLPIALLRVVAGPMVTTLITDYRYTDAAVTAERWVQIGGFVLDATVDPPVPLASAWVQLESSGGDPLQTTISDELGRFSFEQLQPGSYQLRWRSIDRAEPVPRLVQVPSPSGEYDLRFE